MIELRAYQQDALTAINDAEQRGVRRQLGVAATGLGKTIIFTALARRRAETRTLILAHRDELIDQALRKVREAWPEQTSVGKVKGSDNHVASHVVVASVQTLARANRLTQLTTFKSSLAHGFRDVVPFGLVVVDEAHHSTADSYQRVLEALNAGQSDGPLLLGVTATPDRGDGKGLDGQYDEIVFTYDLVWGIREGYLCDMRGTRVTIDMDMSKVKVRRGDYDAGQTGAIMEAAGAPQLIVAAWQEHAADRRTLVFTPTVELAAQVRDAFTAAGIAAGWVHGGMDMAERAATLRDYSAGRLQVVANCAVLTEGYDEPRTDCVVIARPTKSRALYAQMVGRGTRLHPEKTDCLVLDVVGASLDHSLVTIPSLFGIRREFEHEMTGANGAGAAAVLERQVELDVRDGRLRAEDADLFRKVRRDGLAWVQVHTHGSSEKRYAVNLGRTAGSLVLRQLVTGEDVWLCGHRNSDGDKTVLVQNVSLAMAQGVGEDAARTLAPDTWRFNDVKAKWRQQPPTQKQIEVARKWRVRIDPRWNAGELSDQVTARIELSKAGRRR